MSLFLFVIIIGQAVYAFITNVHIDVARDQILKSLKSKDDEPTP